MTDSVSRRGPHPTREVYITAAGAYLPGEPVDNDRIENVLGLIDGKPSRLGTIAGAAIPCPKELGNASGNSLRRVL